jgi:hypothetical protein
MATVILSLSSSPSPSPSFFLPLISLRSLFLSQFFYCQFVLGCCVYLCVPIDNFIVIDFALKLVDNLTPLWSCWWCLLLLCDDCYKSCKTQISHVMKSHYHFYFWWCQQSDSLWSCCCCVTIDVQMMCRLSFSCCKLKCNVVQMGCFSCINLIITISICICIFGNLFFFSPSSFPKLN